MVDKKEEIGIGMVNLGRRIATLLNGRNVFYIIVIKTAKGLGIY